MSVVDEDTGMLHAKLDKAITSIEVSKDLFERVDSKLNGLYGKVRTVQRWALVIGALVVANLALTVAAIIVLVAGGHR